MPRAPIALVVWLASLAGVGALAAAADDEQFLSGLRARGLYELAEKYCADRLALSAISDEKRASLTIEWSRSLAQHALEAPPAEAPGLWQQSGQVVEEFAARHPLDPRLTLVRLQGALAAAARGEAAREAIEGSYDVGEMQAARDLLRGAIAQLEELAETIANQLQRAARAGPHELSPAQLQSLETNVRYELARALRNQALCYPLGTADRINSLSLAAEQLAVMTSAEPRTPLDWSAALAEIACLRLLGEYPAAQRKIAGYEKRKPPAGVAQQLRAERVRLALARGRIDEALSEAGAPGPGQATGAEAELARLEALLAAWKRAGGQRNASDAADWQRRAVEQVRAIDESYDAHSRRQATALLARAMTGSTLPQSADALAQAAAGYYRAGQLDKALATYDRAAQTAGARQPRKAFEFGLAAATIEKERSHFRQALERYSALAELTDAPRAAEAHLLAIHCAAQLAQAEQPPNLDHYQRLLRDHVATWPEGPTASQAWVWLGRLAEHRHDWQQAVEALRHLKPDDAQFADAVQTMGRCYESWLDELHQRDADGRQLADDALEWFERATPSRGGQPGAASRDATLSAARIWLKEMPTGALGAERLLRDALRRDPDAPDAWKASAGRLLAAALAAQDKTSGARDVLAQIPHDSIADRLATFQTFAEIRGRATADVARGLAEVELIVDDSLLADRQQLDGPTVQTITRERALALAALGRRAEALKALQALASAFPRDGRTHEAWAELLMRGDESDQRAALSRWAEVAARSRPATPRWFRAHYGLARTQLELGQLAQARETIRRLAARYPGFGGSGMKQKFDDLAAEIERPDPGRSRSK